MKRIATILFSSFLLFGCNNGNQSKERLDLIVYAEEKYAPTIREIAQEAISNKEYPFQYSVTVLNYGEGSSLENGNLFLCPSSQLPYLNIKYGLEELSSDLYEGIDDKAIKHFKIDSKSFGVPLSSRVGNYLIYDKSKLSESDIVTYEGLYEKKKELELNFDSPFYDPGYFLSSLATFGYSLTIKQSFDGAKIKAVVEHNFNSPSVIEKIKEYSRLFALDEQSTYPDKGYMAYSYGLWFADYAKQSFGDNLAIAPLPKYGDDEYTPVLEDLGICVYNMAERKYAMPLVNDLIKALSSEKSQRLLASKIGLDFTPTSLKARDGYPLPESLYTKGLEKALPSRGYPAEVLSLTSNLIEAVNMDNGKGDEQALREALNDYCDSLDKLVITAI